MDSCGEGWWIVVVNGAEWRFVVVGGGSPSMGARRRVSCMRCLPACCRDVSVLADDNGA